VLLFALRLREISMKKQTFMHIYKLSFAARYLQSLFLLLELFFFFFLLCKLMLS
jgi:hypothetical protein